MNANGRMVSITDEELKKLQAELETGNGKTGHPAATWNTHKNGSIVLTDDGRCLETIHGTFKPVDENALPKKHSVYEEVDFGNGKKAYIRKPGM